MTTDELNAIVQAVMLELEKAGVDFDFKAEVPQADDLVYVMRGTADKYMGITVKWQNLLDIIVKKATDAKDEAVSAKDIALQNLATIQGIESNISSMKSSVDASKANVASMKASVETSEANVTQMKASVEAVKSDVERMKTSVEATKTEVEGLLDTKADVTYVDGELAKKVNYTDSLTYEEIMATTDLTNKVASASAVKDGSLKFYVTVKSVNLSNGNQNVTYDIPSGITPLLIIPLGIGAAAVWPTKLIIWDSTTDHISFYVEASTSQLYDIRYVIFYR